MFDRSPHAWSRASHGNIGWMPAGLMPVRLIPVRLMPARLMPMGRKSAGRKSAWLSIACAALLAAPASFAGEADSPLPDTSVKVSTASAALNASAAHAARAALLSSMVIDPGPVSSAVTGSTGSVVGRAPRAPQAARTPGVVDEGRIIRNVAERHTAVSRTDPELVEASRVTGAATYATVGGATAGGYSSLYTGSRSGCVAGYSAGYSSPGFSLRYRDEHWAVDIGSYSTWRHDDWRWRPWSCYRDSYVYYPAWAWPAASICSSPRYYESSWGSPIRIDPHLDRDRCRSVTVVKDPYTYDRKPIICHKDQVTNLKPSTPVRVAVSKKAAGK